MLLDGAHPEIVADDEAPPAELVAQQAGDRRARERGRIARVPRAVEDVRGHHGVHPALGEQRAIRLAARRPGLAVSVTSTKPRCESVTLEPWPGKCFSAVRTPSACMPSMYARACAVTRAGVGAEAAPVADDHRVVGIDPDVHHRGQVPADAGRLASMNAIRRASTSVTADVVGVAQLLMRRRGRVAGGGGQAHDPSALGVHRDQHRASGARLGPRGDPVRELRHLVRDRPRCARTAARRRRALAQQPFEVRVALAGRPRESDEQQIAQPRDERGHPRGIRRGERAAPHERHGDRDDDQQRASGWPRATKQLALPFSRLGACGKPQAAQKGPDARRRPRAAREAYSLYVERAAAGANEAAGPFSAAC